MDGWVVCLGISKFVGVVKSVSSFSFLICEMTDGKQSYMLRAFRVGGIRYRSLPLQH